MTPGTTVTVLVSRSCGACIASRDLARRLATDRPHLTVRVQDIDEPGWTQPAGFIGTPTWLIDGNVVSLGNPSQTWLLERLNEVTQ